MHRQALPKQESNPQKGKGYCVPLPFPFPILFFCCQNDAGSVFTEYSPPSGFRLRYFAGLHEM